VKLVFSLVKSLSNLYNVSYRKLDHAIVTRTSLNIIEYYISLSFSWMNKFVSSFHHPVSPLFFLGVVGVSVDLRGISVGSPWIRRTFPGAALLVERTPRRPLAGRDAAAVAVVRAAAVGGAHGAGADEDAAGVEPKTGAAGGEAEMGKWCEMAIMRWKMDENGG
jgi:hypothetical protein